MLWTPKHLLSKKQMQKISKLVFANQSVRVELTYQPFRLTFQSLIILSQIILRKHQKQKPGMRRSRAFVTLLSSQQQVCFAQNRCAKDLAAIYTSIL